MTVRTRVALVALTTLIAACTGAGAPSGDAASIASASLETNDQKASYAIGLNVGGQLSDARDRLDRAAFLRGVDDALRGNEPAVPGEELQTVLQAFGQEIQTAASEARARQGEENRQAGEAYLAENGAREGVTTTASGLQFEVLREGDGATPTRDDRVKLHYRGTLIDGTEFDSSYDGDPAEFSAGGLIAGFTEALLLMREGGKYRIVIPPNLAYGPSGSGPKIGPNATLVFEIELIEVLK